MLPPYPKGPIEAFLSHFEVVSQEQVRCMQFAPSCALSSVWHPLQTGILHSGHLACPGSGSAWTMPLLLAGDVHIAIMDRNGQLEVEVIEARGLTPKPGSKSLPGKAEHLGEGFWKWGPAREGVHLNSGSLPLAKSVFLTLESQLES